MGQSGLTLTNSKGGLHVTNILASSQGSKMKKKQELNSSGSGGNLAGNMSKQDRMKQYSESVKGRMGNTGFKALNRSQTAQEMAREPNQEMNYDVQ
jgi:hypothetical protein